MNDSSPENEATSIANARRKGILFRALLLPRPLQIRLWKRLLQSRNGATETYNAPPLQINVRAERGTHAAIDLRHACRPPRRLVLSEGFAVVISVAGISVTCVHTADDAYLVDRHPA